LFSSADVPAEKTTLTTDEQNRTRPMTTSADRQAGTQPGATDVPLDRALDQTGRVVIVTGGTKGVGRGIVERFLEAGADVVITARNAPDEPVTAAGRAARFVAADVRDAEQIDAVVADAVDTFGRLDVLVNNAGGAPMADAATASPRFSQSIVNLNLMAPLYFAQKANLVMQEQGSGGAIVNIGSVSGIRPSPGTAAYGAAKAGLLSLTTSLAIEWAPKVRVNLVTGGLIETEQAHLHYGDAEGVARVAATVPMERMGTPRDIADACLFLASPLASYVNGANLVVHGGGEKPAFLGAAEG
jgi:NAD(P)-dependent dehydrogenase (short-subunit alcohol dehydrogenase family)